MAVPITVKETEATQEEEDEEERGKRYNHLQPSGLESKNMHAVVGVIAAGKEGRRD